MCNNLISRKITNIEAIEILKANYPDACYEQLRKAVDAAIEALKAQDATGDTISRQAAIDTITEYGWGDNIYMSVGNLAGRIERLPSTPPEQDCILKQFGECTYKETGCSDCRMKVKIKAALSSEKSAQPDVPDTAEVNRKKGKWINGKCSECNAHAPFYAMASTYYESAYCPNCGANMRERKKEKEK